MIIGCLIVWVGVGIAIDGALYALQRRFLTRATATGDDRVRGHRRAAVRLRERLIHAARFAAALTISFAAGWLASWPMSTVDIGWLAAALGVDCLLRASIADMVFEQGFVQRLKRAVLDLIPMLVAGILMGAVLWLRPGIVGWLLAAFVGAAFVYGRGRLLGGRRTGPTTAEPLADTALAGAIAALARDCGVVHARVRVQSTGLAAQRLAARVVNDNSRGDVIVTRALVDALGVAGVVAVVAHEFGHLYHDHVRRYDALKAIWVGAYILLAGAVVVGFGPEASLIGWLWLLFAAAPSIGWPALPALAAYRRRCEYQADAFAGARVARTTLIATLGVLFAANTHRAGQHRFYHAWYATHPRDADRLAALGD